MTGSRTLTIFALALVVGTLLLVAGLAYYDDPVAKPPSDARDASSDTASSTVPDDAQEKSIGAGQLDSRAGLSSYSLVDYDTRKPIRNASILIADDAGRNTRTETGFDGGFVTAGGAIVSISSLDQPVKFGNILHVEGQEVRVNALGHISFVFKVDPTLEGPSDLHVGVVDAKALSLRVTKAILAGDLHGLRGAFDGLASERKLKRHVPSLGVSASLVVPAYAALRVIGINPSLYAIRPTHELVFGQQVSPKRFRPGGDFVYPCPLSSELVIKPGEESEVVIEILRPRRIAIATRSFSDQPCTVQLKRLHVMDVDSIQDFWNVLRGWYRDKAGKQGEVLEYEPAFPGTYQLFAVGRRAANDFVLSWLHFEIGNADRELDLDQGIGPHRFTVKLLGPTAPPDSYYWLLEVELRSGGKKGSRSVVFNEEAIGGTLGGEIHFRGLMGSRATLTLSGKDFSRRLAIDTRKASFYALEDTPRE